jgi:hypothetical protein
MKRQTGTFVARDDFDQEYTIYIFTNYTHSRSYGHPDELIEGLEELQLADGAPVNPIERGRYQVVKTGAILRSDAPNAL